MIIYDYLYYHDFFYFLKLFLLRGRWKSWSAERGVCRMDVV